MSKPVKICLIVLVPVLVVLLVLYMLVSAVYVPKPAQVVFPQGELTDSIFTEQNNNYEENESLPEKHTFISVPYTVDITEGDGANVGSGTVYQIQGSEEFFIYVTEYDDSTNAQDIIASQFPAVMLINYIPEMTKVTIQIDKRGFINGFAAEYLAETIKASDGTQQTDAAIVGYALDVPEVEYAGRHIYVGVGTTSVSTENLEGCAQILSSVIKTVTKDVELEEERRQEAEKEREEAEKAALAAIDQRMAGAGDVSQPVAQPDVPKSANIPIPVDREYANLVVTVEWDNFNPDAVLELFNPAKTVYFDPSSQSDYGAKFVIPNGEAGQYELRIANAQACGGIRTSHSGSEVEKFNDDSEESKQGEDVYVSDGETTTESGATGNNGFKEVIE
jgi:hypothetical protein